MVVADQSLNLARKWRVKRFSALAGQELIVRMLKNTLYKARFFPVYLFSGQRGSGKTSTARVLAAALNCRNLSLFQKNPQLSDIPCLTCESCVALFEGRHPDFCEIDAASHTGVDSIRQLIDSAGLLPVKGARKIYLIDEAHMLSKAAFNALLKLLENPPSHVIFILATTEEQKIIETVRSRCFPLYFSPVDSDNLILYLQKICTEEKIGCDNAGLRVIAHESEGSVRDALNLIEQVRFSSRSITKEAVFAVLGYLDDDRLLVLFESIIQGRRDKVMHLLCHYHELGYSPEKLWKQCVALLREALWLSCGVKIQLFADYEVRLKRMCRSLTTVQLKELLATMYTYEPTFVKTSAKQGLFDVICIELMHIVRDGDFHDEGEGSEGAAGGVNAAMDEGDVITEDASDEEEDDDDISDHEAAWKSAVAEVEALGDHLLTSIFKQSLFKSFDQETQQLFVEWTKRGSFFHDMVHEKKALWQPIVRRYFSDQVDLQFCCQEGHEHKAFEQIKPKEAVRRVTTTKSSHVNKEKKQLFHEAS
ncbi:MAG: DNA polymerase III subunit gamma/tau, partial [Candidatus Babeliales bacterium]